MNKLTDSEVKEVLNSTKPLRWNRLVDVEPSDDGIVLVENEGHPYLAQYLPPRRGHTVGDWQCRHSDDVYEASKNDLWLDADSLFYAAAVWGYIEFIPSIINHKKSK